MIALFLIFIARPGAVVVSLLPWKMAVREKVMVSWVGRRNAVTFVHATFQLLAGIPRAETIFDPVFFIVLAHGTSIPLIASGSAYRALFWILPGWRWTSGTPVMPGAI